MKAITVFSEAIRFLKDHLMSALNERNASNEIAVDDIMWVLTVPAIWTDTAKQFMREAAKQVRYKNPDASVCKCPVGISDIRNRLSSLV